MESQLQSLIDKIHSDGIAQAQQKSDQIIRQAQNQAELALRQAKEEAERIVAGAKEESRRIEDAGKKALEQAGRNLILSLRKSISTIFDQILQENVADHLTSEVIFTMLEKLAHDLELKGEAKQEFELLLGKENAKVFEDGLLKKLQKRLRTGITIRPLDGLSAGFYIGEKNGNAFYDFTDKGITEILSRYLSPRLAEILNGPGH